MFSDGLSSPTHFSCIMRNLYFIYKKKPHLNTALHMNAKLGHLAYNQVVHP